MVVGSKVLVGSSKVEGVVMEIEHKTGSVLVKHLILVDGRNKEVNQWYSGNYVTEVVEKVEVTAKPNKKFKIREDKYAAKDIKVELGVIPEKSDSDGE